MGLVLSELRPVRALGGVEEDKRASGRQHGSLVSWRLLAASGARDRHAEARRLK